MWQIWTLRQKRQCNVEGIHPDKNAFGKIKHSVLLHSNALRCVILQMILNSLEVELRVLSFLYSLSIHTSHFYVSLSFFPLSVFTYFKHKHKTTTTHLSKSRVSYFDSGPLRLLALISFYLFSPLSFSFTHAHSHTQKHTRSHCHPHAFIYSLYFLIQFDEWVTAWHFIRQD